MNYYEFFTQNNEFKIVLTKKKRIYSLGPYSNYTCTIEFRNSLDQTVLKIDNTESDFLRFIEGLNDFLISFGQTLTDNLYFTNNGIKSNYFCFIAIKDYSSYPAEDDDTVYLGFYEESPQGTILRLNLYTDISWIEEFIYSLFQIVEDIPYLSQLTTTTCLEYIDYSALNRPY